jgi:hypothetical protein
MLVPNLIVINYPKHTSGPNALTKRKEKETGVLRTFHRSSLSSKPGNEYFIQSGVHQQICKEPEFSPANRQILHVR